MLKRITRGVLASVVSVGLLLPLSHRRAEAQSITLDIGQPNVWSLAQAHYLLAVMRHENRGLHATTPSADQLNPNSINGVRLDILRTFLGVSAEFSGVAGTQNRAALQSFQQAMARRQEAQTRVAALTEQHLGVVREISDLNFQLAQLPAPPPAGQTEDPQVAQRRRELTAMVAARTPVRDALATEITNLNGILNAAAPTLSGMSSQAAPTPPSATFNDDLKTIMDKLVGTSSTPALNASMALDNYVQMQYEIIAKQLTLLRDEVGPDERLIFLELPSSLYSVPKRDDNYVVQTRWNVHSYFGTCSDLETVSDSDEEGAGAQGAPRAAAAASGAAEDGQEAEGLQEDDGPRERNQKRPITIDAIETMTMLNQRKRLVGEFRAFQKLESSGEKQSFLTSLEGRDSETAAALRRAQSDDRERRVLENLASFDPRDFSQKLEKMVWRPVSNKGREEVGPDPCATALSKGKFRIVDIIPRQSALNVNDTHATQKGFALTAKFLSIFGFGGSLDFQRQRSVYEQFIHQDVFASGFGKGLDSFGWTIGPVPGTKRLAPGPRTTYAILAIPRGALAVKLEADAAAFRNNRPPDDPSAKPLVEAQQFTVLVPQRETEGFWVDSVDYTPVASGQRVSVLLRGKYFSPLTGVTVDSLPLKRAVALAKHESEDTTNETDTTSPGEFEYLNPNELILSFKLASDYVGTPVITLITPEKTAAINYFNDLLINHRPPQTSLLRHSQVEPMFIGSFRLGGLQVTSGPGARTVRARLAGSGFRRRAEIFVNGRRVGYPQLLSTNLYGLSFARPAEPTWTISYRLGQQEASLVYNPAVDGLSPIAPSIDGIENPSTGKPEGLPQGQEYVIIRGRNLDTVDSVFFGTEAATIDDSRRHPNVLFVQVPKGKEGGVRVLLVGITNDGQSVSNILDFQTPGKAIYKYVPKAAGGTSGQQQGGGRKAKRARREGP